MVPASPENAHGPSATESDFGATKQAAPDLEALRTRRQQLVGMLAAEQARVESAPSEISREIRNHIFDLERQISALDDQLRDRSKRSADSEIGSRTKRNGARTILIGFAAVVVATILILPLWLVAYPPLLDYPNHLARAFILAHLHDPAFHFSDFYAADWGPYPYLTTDVLIIALQRVFSIFTAGRIVLSLYALAVPFGSWFLVRKANRRNDWLICIALIASYNLFFLWGFLNQQLSTALLLIVLGIWIQFLNRPNVARWLLMLCVVTILYLTHLMGFGICGLLVIAYGLLTRKKLLHVIYGALTFVPGALLHLLFRVRTAPAWQLEFRPVPEKWERLSVFVEGYSPRLDQITLVVILACCFVAWWRNREFRWNRPWPAMTAIAFALYWIFPSGYGFGSDADIRLLPLTLLFLPLVANVGRRGLWIAIVLFVLFLARSANVTRTFLAQQPELAGLAQSFQHTNTNARVLPIVEAKDEAPQYRPYAHFWAYGVIERGCYSPYLFTEQGVLALENKLELTSPDGFWDLQYDEEPEWQDIADDYDYVWAYHVERFAKPLSGIGDLIYQSGDLQLYRIRKTDQDESAKAKLRKSLAHLRFLN